MYCGIDVMANLQGMFKISILDVSLNITYSGLHWYLSMTTNSHTYHYRRETFLHHTMFYIHASIFTVVITIVCNDVFLVRPFIDTDMVSRFHHAFR